MSPLAGRPAFFGGGPASFFYPLAALAVLICAWGFWHRRGRAWPPALDRAQAPWGLRLQTLAQASLGALALGSLLWNLHRNLHPFLRGTPYLVFALALELAAGLLLASLLGLMLRSLVLRRGDTRWLALACLLWLTLGGLALVYARLAATRPDWAWAQPLAWWFADRWSWGGPSDAWFAILWWTHAASALVLIALAPWLRPWRLLKPPA